MKLLKNNIKLTAISIAVASLLGCAATQTVLEHRNLDTSTRLSKTIFLDPVAPSAKTIYIAAKNTSDQDIDITPQLAEALTLHGYHVTSNPNQAHYMLQANILKVGKMSLAASHAALNGGYGSALTGAGVGTAIGALSGNGNAMIGGGIAGSLIGLAADSLVKDVNYTMITDVQISERVGKGVKVAEQFDSSLKQGLSSKTIQTSSKISEFQRYRTRIVSNADKVNLKFAEARPALEHGLVKALTGIF